MSHSVSEQPTVTHIKIISEAPTLTTIWGLPMVITTLRAHTHQSDFAALCLLSRYFYYQGNTSLYGVVTLYSDDLNDTIAISAFHRTLTTNSELAQYVRSLSCISWRPQELLDDPDEESPHLSMLPDLITKLHRLEALHIKDWYPPYTHTVRELAECLPSLKSLKHLAVNIEVPEWENSLSKLYAVNTSILNSAITHPSLKSLATTLQQATTSQELALPPTASISKLTLNNLYVTMESLRRVVTATTQVNDLSIEFVRYIDSDESHIPLHLDCQELGAILMASRLTLKRLRVVANFWACGAGDTDYGGGADAPWGTVSTLSLARHAMLKHLEIAPELLLGWNREVSPSLYTQLPASLESLHFRLDYGAWYRFVWDFKSLSDALHSYLTYHPSLKYLILEYFGRHIDKIAVPLHSIKPKCEKLGIHFHLKLV